MARTTAVNGHANSHDEKGANGAIAANSTAGSKTDYSRWRLLDENGRQTWQYLATDDQVEKWP